VVLLKRRSFRRPASSLNHLKSTVEPIREEDFAVIKELLSRKSDLLSKYIKNLCFFRMSIYGFINESKLHIEELDKIIDKIDQKREDHHRIQLPREFEIARVILLRIRERQDFEKVLKEVEFVA
jgi:hypothetical protein